MEGDFNPISWSSLEKKLHDVLEGETVVISTTLSKEADN